MKDALESIPTEQTTSDQEGFANRKLIRPSLSRSEHGHGHNHQPNHQPNHQSNHQPTHQGSDRRSTAGKKTTPVEQTNAENYYYQKQMQSKTPMVIVLRDGEEVHGIIEWYDKHCLKLNRTGEPNLMIYKPAIKYMFKEGENGKK